VPLLATDLEGMLNKTMMDKLLMVPVHKPDQLDLLQARKRKALTRAPAFEPPLAGSSPVTGYAFHATGDGSITVSTNDVTRASGYAMGYADPPPPLPQRLCLYCSVQSKNAVDSQADPIRATNQNLPSHLKITKCKTTRDPYVLFFVPAALSARSVGLCISIGRCGCYLLILPSKLTS
jgi:hypothetical protein